MEFSLSRESQSTHRSTLGPDVTTFNFFILIYQKYTITPFYPGQVQLLLPKDCEGVFSTNWHFLIFCSSFSYATRDVMNKTYVEMISALVAWTPAIF